MKKIIALFLSLCLICVAFAGCGEASDSTKTESTTKAEAASITLKIDGNKFSDDFSEIEFYEELDAIEGIFYTKNTEADEYTLTMTETAYKKLKSIKSEPVKENFNAVISNEENYVTDIKYNDDFRNIKVFAQKEKLPESFTDFDETLLAIMGSAMAYQIYTKEGQSVTITVSDAETEEVIKEVSYPVVIQ